MIKEAIILAGGQGTRLQSVVSEVPKPMAPIQGIPFLNFIFDELQFYGIQKIYLAIGYLPEVITACYGKWYKNMEIEYIIEETPLGTGGAIKQAIAKTKSSNILIVNGDTLFKINLHDYFKYHNEYEASLTVALKDQEKADRYGTVILNEQNQITSFQEKKENSSGWINGGIYLINKEKINFNQLPNVFSFEKEVLEKEYQNKTLYGYKSSAYFIDIGIPSDFEKAQHELIPTIKSFPKINNEWTLFLDRDGVINKKRENDYVKSIQEFEFLPGVIETINELTTLFNKLIIVTNQQCIGKKIISENELTQIHDYMLEELNKDKPCISKVYYAPNLAQENSPLRKPNTGMADLAKIDFHSIDFSKSIMVGDSISDMQFGKHKGMITIGINLPKSPLIDFHLTTLAELPTFLEKTNQN